MNYQLSHHAQVEMQRRGISIAMIESVLNNPQQIIPERERRKVYQSQIDFGGKIFLLRAIVVDDVEPVIVVTLYRTSKIQKYWVQP